MFSASLLNAVRFGFSRAGYYFTGEPTPGTPAASVPSFIAGFRSAPWWSAAARLRIRRRSLGLAGSNNGSNLHVARNLYTIADDLTYTKGRHQFRFGVWFQPFQSNEELALSQYGQLTFTGIPNFVAGMATFLYDPAPTPLSWRVVLRRRPTSKTRFGFARI